MEEVKGRERKTQRELQKARDELRNEKAKWKEEMDALTQVGWALRV